MSDYEVEKIGEYVGCDIIKLDFGHATRTDYVCKSCGMVFGDTKRVDKHKCEGDKECNVN